MWSVATRPPTAPAASRTWTSQPASTSRVATDRPARPAPTTTTSARSGALTPPNLGEPGGADIRARVEVSAGRGSGTTDTRPDRAADHGLRPGALRRPGPRT